VTRLDEAVPVWAATLGTTASPPELIESQRVRVAFLSAGAPHIELLEPTDADSPVGRFVRDRGGGLHHVAFRVPRVDAALEAVAARGGRLVDRTARPGARGRRVGFAHPSAHGGVLVEFVEGP